MIRNKLFRMVLNYDWIKQMAALLTYIYRRTSNLIDKFWHLFLSHIVRVLVMRVNSICTQIY